MEKSEEDRKNIFPNAYCPAERKYTELTVLEKNRTDVRGHMTYVLVGITKDGHRCGALVNKSQWDRYDVPIKEKKISKKGIAVREAKRIKSQKPEWKTRPPKKFRRKVISNEVEKWLAEHYDIDFDSLDGLDGPIVEQ